MINDLCCMKLFLINFQSITIFKKKDKYHEKSIIFLKFNKHIENNPGKGNILKIDII